MGSCLSKKSVCASSPPPVALPDPPEKPKSETQPEKKEESVVKKEIFVIRHRISHESERQRPEEKPEIKKVEEFVEKGKNVNDLDGGGVGGCGGGGAPVRTSSCTKEEVDAILIQCGRLSRSSSSGKAVLSSENGGRKYSGSKRSYDFDRENGKCDDNNADGDDEAVARENRRRERHRHHSQGRRRTPSRESERDQTAQQRSGSRERGSGGGGGRRVSRSPGRRSESPIPTNNGTNSNSSAANGSSRPGKMVSVPATVSGGGGAEPNTAAAVKRIQVKRNVGGASPRARSPARFNENHTQNQPQPVSLSRSNSRKAEHSPYRRNPLGEIDTNIITQKPSADNKMSSNGNCKNQDQLVGCNVILAGLENPKGMMSVTRSRSSRLSRDLDINPEALSNPNTSYTALLLEDIQNFHQKSTPPPPPAAFSLPPCLTKACSILEAVADLNSTNDFQRKPNPINDASSAVKNGKQQLRENSILESEIVATDDIMQPSFHKYVTVRRGEATGDEEDDLDQQESSGSNSIVGSQQQCTSSSCWEPNSAESTDRWTLSSRSMNEISPVGYQRQIPPSDEGGKKLKKRDSDQKQSGIGRGRIVNGVAAAAATSR